jgi:3-oxoacyl-[acyl-carrier-protein] synthase II
MGIIAACGQTLDEFWDAITAPVDAPARTKIEGFDPHAWMGKADVNRTDDRIHYAAAAAAQAFADAGEPTFEPLRAGVIIGNTHGAALRIEHEELTLERDGRKAVPPYLAVLANDNAPAAVIAQRFGARNTCQMVGGACASGTYAVGDGAALIRSGRCDLVFAGATAGDLPESLLAAYENLRVISASGFVRPFDVRREGFVYSPGAAVLVLESLERARARGARIYGEVAGSASTNDAWHPIRQSGVGAVECMQLALADAGLDAGSVVHVNAHGSGTMLNDTVETEAIRSVFAAGGGSDGAMPSITSIKRVTGHSLGAAGSFEAVSVLLSFARGALPPAGIDVDLDPALGEVDIVVGGSRPWVPGPTISNSFGLGGQNGTVVLVPPS